jgi:hypothetical protein
MNEPHDIPVSVLKFFLRDHVDVVESRISSLGRSLV